jgi:Leu/Phe-tRNA-protein transferase
MMSSTRMTLLVGTTKGAFLISDDNDRRGWVIPTNRCRLPTHSLKSGRSATRTVRCMPAPNQRTFWQVRTAVKIGIGYKL